MRNTSLTNTGSEALSFRHSQAKSNALVEEFYSKTRTIDEFLAFDGVLEKYIDENIKDNVDLLEQSGNSIDDIWNEAELSYLVSYRYYDLYDKLDWDDDKAHFLFVQLVAYKTKVSHLGHLADIEYSANDTAKDKAWEINNLPAKPLPKKKRVINLDNEDTQLTLIAKVLDLKDSDVVTDVFSGLELAILLDTPKSELEKALTDENAQYLWELLVRHSYWLENEEDPGYWKVKEFSWYGYDLTPNQAAIEVAQAEVQKLINNHRKEVA